MESAPPYGQPINWTNTVFSLATPAVALVGGILYVRAEGLAAGDLIVFALMMLASSISVIPGYHRYFAHRSYSAHRALDLSYLLWPPMSVHPSALVWASGP